MNNLAEISDPTFLSRFYKTQEQMQENNRYLISLMRTSIFELIISKYLFQYQTKEFSLQSLIEEYAQDSSLNNKLNQQLEYYQKTFKDEGSPLYIYSQIASEILKLLKEDFNKIKYDKFILKIEYFLSLHFENNFYEQKMIDQVSDSFFDKMYLQKQKTNFNYSLNAFRTIFKFIKVFEHQSLATRTAEDFMHFRDYFISEKVFYFYNDKMNKDKQTIGNFLYYLINNLTSKIEALANDKVNNYQMENYTLMNIYMIKKVIQNYSFYFHKKPELEHFFFCLHPLKSWPLPVGGYITDICETIINECAFQGVTLINKLREMYFIDFIEQNVVEIDTRYFNSPILVYSNAWETEHKSIIHSETQDSFNLAKFLKFLVTKEHNERYNKLNLSEFLIKVFITYIYNSKQPFDDDSFTKIYQNFYTGQCDNETNEDNSSTKSNLDILLKLLDVGFDKGIEDFDKEINIIANKVIQMEPILNLKGTEECPYQNTLPITDLRNYLKPRFLDIKKLMTDSNDDSKLNLYELYKTYFKHVCQYYFPHLFQESEDANVQQNLQNLREKLYINYKIDIVLIEQNKMITSFINQLEDFYKNIKTNVSDEDYDTFWHYFVPSKDKLEIKYLLHIIPHYENHSKHPFKLFEAHGNNETDCYLSEYIASVDHVYKNVIFLPWLCKCDSVFSPYIQNCQNIIDNILEFPNLNVIYSFLKNSLNYYMSDANGLFNLNLYQFKIESLSYDVKFWRGFTLSNTDPKTITILRLSCVDYLGLENNNADEEDIEIRYEGAIEIRLYNLFFKTDVPFNYNMPSNNEWLELFVYEKYNPVETEKMCNYNNFVESANKTKYYEEFNVPEMEISTLYKNYKVKKMTIEINKLNSLIKIDNESMFNMETLAKPENRMVEFKLDINPYKVNGEQMQLPISTFVSL